MNCAWVWTSIFYIEKIYYKTHIFFFFFFTFWFLNVSRTESCSGAKRRIPLVVCITELLRAWKSQITDQCLLYLKWNFGQEETSETSTMTAICRQQKGNWVCVWKYKSWSLTHMCSEGVRGGNTVAPWWTSLLGDWRVTTKGGLATLQRPQKPANDRWRTVPARVTTSGRPGHVSDLFFSILLSGGNFERDIWLEGMKPCFLSLRQSNFHRVLSSQQVLIPAKGFFITSPMSRGKHSQCWSLSILLFVTKRTFNLLPQGTGEERGSLTTRKEVRSRAQCVLSSDCGNFRDMQVQAQRERG